MHESWFYVKERMKQPCLNVGCGKHVFENMDNLDIEQQEGQKTIQIKEDFQYTKLPDECYNTVLLLNVIEHSPCPSGLIKQAYRVLKEEGILIISAPFVTKIHKQPLDYWRFTKEGLIYLCTSNGFTLKEIEGYIRPAYIDDKTKEVFFIYYRGVFIKK